MRWFLAIFALLLLVSPVLAQDNVFITKHNLGSAGTAALNDPTLRATNTDKVCVFCHTPHGGNPAVPLWNHALSTTAVYAEYTSSTMEMEIIGGAGLEGLGGVTNMCLSCHDGTVAMNNLVNVPNELLPGAPDNAGKMSAKSGQAFIGVDLTNDHPVGIVYDTATATGDPSFNPPGTLALARLFGTAPNLTVECGSCHNPHESVLVPFMRANNAQSALCRDCHIK